MQKTTETPSNLLSEAKVGDMFTLTRGEGRGMPVKVESIEGDLVLLEPNVPERRKRALTIMTTLLSGIMPPEGGVNWQFSKETGLPTGEDEGQGWKLIPYIENPKDDHNGL